MAHIFYSFPYRIMEVQSSEASLDETLKMKKVFDFWIYQGHIKNAANFENYEENFKLFNHDEEGT